jgi:hypothetical protein
MSRFVAAILTVCVVALVALQTLSLLGMFTTKDTAWEYMVVRALTEGNSRTGDEAIKYSSIDIDDVQLAVLGKQGWELAGLYIENETAYPNFGSPGYVTGLRANIRPQLAVLIFKRPIPH